MRRRRRRRRRFLNQAEIWFQQLIRFSCAMYDGSFAFSCKSEADQSQAQAYLHQFEHLRNRACIAIRSALQKSLEKSVAQVDSTNCLMKRDCCYYHSHCLHPLVLPLSLVLLHRLLALLTLPLLLLLPRLLCPFVLVLCLLLLPALLTGFTVFSSFSSGMCFTVVHCVSIAH